MKVSIFVFIILFFLNGCSLFVGEDSFGKSWTGEPIEDLISQWGKPAEKLTNDNGKVEVIYKIFNGDCIYHFYTNSKGIISSYKYVSSGWGACKPIG